MLLGVKEQHQASFSIFNIMFLTQLHMFTWNQAGGPSYSVELGRRDGRISTKASVQRKLPHPTFNLDQLNSMFASHGLSQTDMIALSGI